MARRVQHGFDSKIKAKDALAGQLNDGAFLAPSRSLLPKLDCPELSRLYKGRRRLRSLNSRITEISRGHRLSNGQSEMTVFRDKTRSQVQANVQCCGRAEKRARERKEKEIETKDNCRSTTQKRRDRAKRIVRIYMYKKGKMPRQVAVFPPSLLCNAEELFRRGRCALSCAR